MLTTAPNLGFEKKNGVKVGLYGLRAFSRFVFAGNLAPAKTHAPFAFSRTRAAARDQGDERGGVRVVQEVVRPERGIGRATVGYARRFPVHVNEIGEPPPQLNDASMFATVRDSMLASMTQTDCPV